MQPFKYYYSFFYIKMNRGCATAKNLKLTGPNWKFFAVCL